MIGESVLLGHTTSGCVSSEARKGVVMSDNKTKYVKYESGFFGASAGTSRRSFLKSAAVVGTSALLPAGAATALMGQATSPIKSPSELPKLGRIDIHGHFTPPILIETMGAGVALFDYDNDGRLDIFVVNGAPLDDPTPLGAISISFPATGAAAPAPIASGATLNISSTIWLLRSSGAVAKSE